MQGGKDVENITQSSLDSTENIFSSPAKRDIEDLVRKGLLVPKGAGRGAYYELPNKRLINGSNGSSHAPRGN
jgi:predicted HTH transcriptional regulator